MAGRKKNKGKKKEFDFDNLDEGFVPKTPDLSKIVRSKPKKPVNPVERSMRRGGDSCDFLPKNINLKRPKNSFVMP